MKIRITQRFPDPLKIFKWHVYFALWPRRLDAETVAWLENIARRKTTSQAYHRIGPVRIERPFYLYGPLTNVLTQPGVTIDVSAAQQPGPGLFTPLGPVAGGGISPPQTSGVALSGGSLSHLGQGSPSIFAQGTAYAGNPPPGGHNQTVAKP